MVAKQLEGDYDIVSGTRYSLGGSVFGWDLRRKLTSRVANYIAQCLLNPGCEHTTSPHFEYTIHHFEYKILHFYYKIHHFECKFHQPAATT